MSISACILLVGCLLSGYYHQPAAKIKQLTPIICSASHRYKVQPEVILAVIYRESRFVHYIRSDTDDIGIMQLHCPPKAKGPTCNRCDVRKISCNINRGTRLLAVRKRKYAAHYKHPYYWIQHNNYYSKGYYKKVYSKIRGSRDHAREFCY